MDQCITSITNLDERASTRLMLSGYEAGEMGSQSDAVTCSLYRDIPEYGTDEEHVRIHVQGSISGFAPMQRTVRAPQVRTLDIIWADRKGYQRASSLALPRRENWRAFFQCHQLLQHIGIRGYSAFRVGPILQALCDEPWTKFVGYIMPLETMVFMNITFSGHDFSLISH